jgi:hypothetical protein
VRRPPCRTDPIPDYGESPTIVSAYDGAWSQPSTWSLARVPGDSDVVAIAAGTTVSYDAASSARLAVVSVHAGGKLAFRTDLSRRLLTAKVQVIEGGEFDVGTADHPVAAGVTARIGIAD